MNNKRQIIFEQALAKPESTKKWLLFPFSFLCHAAIVLAVLVFPLMSTNSENPILKVYDVFLDMKVPQAVPPIPVAKKGNPHPKKNQEERQARPVNTGRLVEPVKIPTEIEDESLDSLMSGDGSGFGPEGAIDGDELGIPFASPIWQDGNNLEKATPITIVQMPRLIKRVTPEYPIIALKTRIQGVVVIEAVTDVRGNVIKTTVIAGHPLLRQAAIDAVKQWVYEPYIVNGFPRPVVFSVKVNFNLQN